MYNEVTKTAFDSLFHIWVLKGMLLSNPNAFKGYPEYRQLIALGPEILPYVLREIDEEPLHCFLLLRELTGENPVPQEDMGNVKRMINAWKRWGSKMG